MKGKNKKGSKNINLTKWINIALIVVPLILIIVGIFVEQVKVPFIFVGGITLAILGIIKAAKAEKYSLIKMTSVLILTAVVFSWLLPNGSFSTIEYIETGLKRVGITDISAILYNSNYFTIDKLLYMTVLGIFYGILANTDAYKAIVSKMAKKLKDYKLPVAIITSVMFIILTSFLSQTFVVFMFVPFMISVLSQMKFDKITAFAITVGSILVGALGAPFGTEALTWFNSSMYFELETAMSYRLIVQIAATFLFILFLVLRIRNMDDKEELMEDPYMLKETKSNVNIIPTAIVLGLVAIVTIIGTIDWVSYFEITTFTEFHTYLMEIVIFEDVYIFSNIFGQYAVALGSWDLLAVSMLLFVFTVLIVLINRMKLDTVIESITNGLKVVVKPMIMILLIFIVFVTVYTSSFMSSVSGFLFDLTVDFNPNTATLVAGFTSIFHVDLALTGYMFSQYANTLFIDSLSIFSIIFTSIHALLQFVLPSSLVLLVGLSYTNVSYKAWIKYIWMFVVGMFIILLVLFNVLYYIA